MSGGAPPSVRDLLAAAIREADAVADAGRHAGDLRELQDRLLTGRLQLAVLGQFKRGKSTLLNALLGAEIVPMGVLPVTAIPTFISFDAADALSVEFLDGRAPDRTGFADRSQIRRRLAEWVTEADNPNNVKGVARVMLQTPSPLLERGLVLIDTPGVGSTHQHNTDAALAALPACDAALFVVSPDPPITDVEARFLGEVKAAAPRIIVVLNKVDLVTAEERTEVERFLRRALHERAQLEAATIFPVSARQALAAQLDDDAEALQRSGLPLLRDFLTDFLAREKQAVLGLAVGRKGAAVLGDLAFELSLRLSALRLPLEDLEQRRRTFEEATAEFDAEHRQVQDLLAADRRRALERLDLSAAALAERLRSVLAAEVDQRVVPTAGSRDAAWLDVQNHLAPVLDRELAAAIEAARDELGAVFQARQARIEDLIDLVTRTAAELLDVPFRAARREDGFEARVLPYWQIGRPEALNPLPPGSFDRLLPGAWRERRARERVAAAIADVALRNVENLRWAVRRNVEEAFRRFGGGLDERFEESLRVTRHMMAAAVARRSAYAGEIAAEAAALEAALGRLSRLQGELAAAAGGDA